MKTAQIIENLLSDYDSYYEDIWHLVVKGIQASYWADPKTAEKIADKIIAEKDNQWVAIRQLMNDGLESDLPSRVYWYAWFSKVESSQVERAEELAMEIERIIKNAKKSH